MSVVKISPKRIPGKWREGYALDFHTVHSEFVGHDEFGNPEFDTTRTPLGELLYQFKYASDKSALPAIVDTVVAFLGSWRPALDSIIPTPPSRSGRRFQPVLSIADSLGERLKRPCLDRALIKHKDTPELKTVREYDKRVRLLEGAYTVRSNVLKGKKVLLLDDLYRSGATLNAITEVLYSQGQAAAVYALALTKTRSKM